MYMHRQKCICAYKNVYAHTKIYMHMQKKHTYKHIYVCTCKKKKKNMCEHTTPLYLRTYSLPKNVKQNKNYFNAKYIYIYVYFSFLPFLYFSYFFLSPITQFTYNKNKIKENFIYTHMYLNNN